MCLISNSTKSNAEKRNFKQGSDEKTEHEWDLSSDEERGDVLEIDLHFKD